MFSICLPLLLLLLLLLALGHSLTSPALAAGRVSSLFLDRNSYGDEGSKDDDIAEMAAGNAFTPIHGSDFRSSHSPLFKEAPAFRNGAECSMKPSEMERASRLGFSSGGGGGGGDDGDGGAMAMEMEMLCDPSSVHIAMTLDMAYIRGSMAAILSIVQHTSCPENVVFHFLASSSSSSSSPSSSPSPSPWPTSSSFLQASMASQPRDRPASQSPPSSMASSSMPGPPLLASSSSSSSPSSSSSSSSSPPPSSPSSSPQITVTDLADLIRSAFPYLRYHVYPFDPSLVIHRISPSIRNALEQPLNYARIYIADMLPRCVGRVIYLDSDVVVVDDIIKLWKTPLDRHPIAAPEYCHADFTKYFTDSFWNRPRFSSVFDDRPRSPCYFNTGVMVMDLHEWRARGFTRKIEEWMDVQKALRIYELGSLPPFLLVFAGDIEPVEHRWNQHGLGGDNMEGKCRGLHEGPVSLLHWSGKGKPWDRLDARKPCPLDSLWAPYDLSILSSSLSSGSGYGM